MLINTIASIAYDNLTDGITSSSGGTLIMLFYTAVSLAPDLKSLFATSETVY
jgi:PAX-interacting protein 1